jgi:hypothetical protein
MSDQPFYVNPLPVCTELHGPENVNDVRDCVMDSIRRYYGTFCDFHQTGLFNMVQTYMVEILKQAGRNPKAVKLALPPPHLQPAFFVNRYFETLDKEKAYRLCLQDSGNNNEFKKQCYVDMKAMMPYPPTLNTESDNIMTFCNYRKSSPYK